MQCCMPNGRLGVWHPAAKADDKRDNNARNEHLKLQRRRALAPNNARIPNVC